MLPQRYKNDGRAPIAFLDSAAAETLCAASESLGNMGVTEFALLKLEPNYQELELYEGPNVAVLRGLKMEGHTVFLHA